MKGGDTTLVKMPDGTIYATSDRASYETLLEVKDSFEFMQFCNEEEAQNELESIKKLLATAKYTVWQVV